MHKCDSATCTESGYSFFLRLANFTAGVGICQGYSKKFFCGKFFEASPLTNPAACCVQANSRRKEKNVVQLCVLMQVLCEIRAKPATGALALKSECEAGQVFWKMRGFGGEKTFLTRKVFFPPSASALLSSVSDPLCALRRERLAALRRVCRSARSRGGRRGLLSR